jgi:hypothetical protein
MRKSTKMKKLLIIILSVLTLLSCSKKPAYEIIIPLQPTSLHQLAAKEIRRYLYLRTGELMEIRQSDNHETDKTGAYILADKSNSIISGTENLDLSGRIASLSSQDYNISSLEIKGKKLLFIAGGDSIGLVYGTYRYLETTGIRFHLHGDVIPDDKTELAIENLNITGSPIFNIRGILPFHDFPEGPDWWNLDDYKAIIAQIPKMGMNFIGFHTYPEKVFGGWEKAEPMVWIGLKEDVNDEGTVNFAYPVLHSNTADSTWGYFRKKTSQFSFGADQLFDVDWYGADYMKNLSDWPHTEKENIEIFNTFGNILDNAFTLAQRLGVKTCIGTEIPLTIPVKVKEKLIEQGRDVTSEQTITEVYEGLFDRIMKTHPLDYYWFWTPESWTWEGENEDAVERTINDFSYAVQAAENVNASFTLATCGWVLGPSEDRTAFDRILPKEMPFSCINRELGFAPIDSGFMRIDGRPQWAIPWMEDDQALVSPQLWVGRTRKDAVDAQKMGCDGLIGIHWRTEILSPNFAALAKAGWETGEWNKQNVAGKRDLPQSDFYLDWASSQFGKENAPVFAGVFSNLDGGPEGMYSFQAKLYRTSTWMGTGPGGVFSNYQTWETISKEFEFVDEFAKLRDSVTGSGNIERFDYWLNVFRYTRQMAEVGCIFGSQDSIAEIIKTEKSSQRKLELANELITLKKLVNEKWGAMVTFLLQYAGTTGDLGTIANLELHNQEQLKVLTRHDSLIAVVTGIPAPKNEFWTDYRGKPRIIVPTKRNVLDKKESLNLKAIVLSESKMNSVILYWRHLGVKPFKKVVFRNVGRGVYSALLSDEEFRGNDFEYYIEAKTENENMIYPGDAPDKLMTVVVW